MALSCLLLAVTQTLVTRVTAGARYRPFTGNDSSRRRPVNRSIVTATYLRSELLDASGWQRSFRLRNRDGDSVLNNAVVMKCSAPTPDKRENNSEWQASNNLHAPSMPGAARCSQVTKG
jgi:hypothetical protein